MWPTTSAGSALPDADGRERKRSKQEDAIPAAALAAAIADASTREDKGSPLDSAAAAVAATEAPAGELEQPVDRSAQILFLVLESQRHAARQARLAYRHQLPAREALDPSAAPKRTLGGNDADGGEEGAVVGGGWWSAAPVVMLRSFDHPQKSADEYDADGYRLLPPSALYGSESHLPYLSADRSFLDTCAASARVCKAWRPIAFGAADRATLSWGGGYALHQAHIWKRAARSSRPRFDPLSALRAFDGGVLRALCLRGAPDDKQRLRAFACALGVVEPAAGARSGAVSAADVRVANVLRGLKVLRLEPAHTLVDALASLGLCSPLPSPPLLSSLVSLHLGRWRSIYKPRDNEDKLDGVNNDDGVNDDDASDDNDDDRRASSSSSPYCFFTRSNLPSLRSLCVSLTSDSDCPFDPFNGAATADPAFLPPLLTRLRVCADAADDPPPAGQFDLDSLAWPCNQPLLASSEFLAALAPSVVSLSVGRALATADGGLEDDEQGDPKAPRDAEGTWDTLDRVAPMSRLLPCLSGMTRLTALEIESDYDCSPGDDNDKRAWALASCAIMAPMSETLRRLSLGEAAFPFLSAGGGISHFPRLPPSLTLLTALDSLEVRACGLSSGGCLCRLTTLTRLVIDTEDYNLEEHSAIAGSDFAPLSRLEFLSLSRPESCWAAVFRNNLPRLATLVTGRFDTRDVGTAMLARTRRDGVAVFEMVDRHSQPPRRLSAADLKGLIEQISVEDDQSHLERHEEEHQAAMSHAASMGAEVAAV